MTGRDLYDLLNNLPGWCDDYTVCFSTGDGNVCVEAIGCVGGCRCAV